MLLKFFLSRRKKSEQQNLFRNFIFGVEDSLVSTVGLLSGVATAGESSNSIVVTGIILIFVEAFSMGIGSFLSEDNSQRSDHSRLTHARIRRAALVMFVSYFLSGFIPLSPYFLLPVSQALPISVLAALLTLGILGIVSAKHNGSNNLWRGFVEMAVLGGGATLIGVGVGTLLS